LSKTSITDVIDRPAAAHFVDCMINDTALIPRTICQDLMEARCKDLDAGNCGKAKRNEEPKTFFCPSFIL
jgi:hypothetical protein